MPERLRVQKGSALGTIAAAAHKGEILVPVIQSLLFNPTYPTFDVRIEAVRKSQDIHPDGWFHPATHPLWTERQLYYYRLHHDAMVREPLDPVGTMATTAGKFWHVFLQTILLYHDVLIPNDPKHCASCKRNRAEHPAEDVEAQSHGHADGIMHPEIDNLSGVPSAVEFKTVNPGRMRSILKWPVNAVMEFAEEWPGYYMQAEEYLRMLGLPRMIVVLISPAWPFEMKEIHLPVEPAVNARTREKYLRVLEAVRAKRPPEPCCFPGSADAKVCNVRNRCPIGIETGLGV